MANAILALQTSALLPLAYTLTIYCFSCCFGLALWPIDHAHTLKTKPSTFFDISDVEYVLDGKSARPICYIASLKYRPGW